MFFFDALTGTYTCLATDVGTVDLNDKATTAGSAIDGQHTFRYIDTTAVYNAGSLNAVPTLGTQIFNIKSTSHGSTAKNNTKSWTNDTGASVDIFWVGAAHPAYNASASVKVLLDGATIYTKSATSAWATGQGILNVPNGSVVKITCNAGGSGNAENDQANFFMGYILD